MPVALRTEKTIFLEAAEIASPAERAAFLEQSCGHDPRLRAAVEALLMSHERSQGMLDATVTPLSEHAGTTIGPYKLLQQIGEGGMGTVYLAEQTQPVQRQVALKLIKPGMDSRQVIARFEAEKHALAMMDHVNISRVLDAGATESGRPYFVMELVHGVPITTYCDDNRLTPRQRLELFVPVCQAIQHAHQKGIIHRDIKPSNVMITLYDGRPVPKVIDFGVAKATEQKLTERTLFTQYGTLVGTLEYMSPEQAEMSALGVDTRSDIYSLGVLLYELLTGSTPVIQKRIKEAAYGEILRMIIEEEPPKPSTRLSESGEALASISALRHTEPAKLSKLMRGELDWIVMKTLEKDRNRRYETANGFAMDVQRYLADETVQACPPSAWYRFHKFARRNKGALVTSALLSAALVIAVVVLAVSTFLISREKAQTEAARGQAEMNLRSARAAVDDMYTQVAEKWLAQQPDLQPLQREFLQKALQFYSTFADETSTDPAIRLETALAFRRVADIQIKLGEVGPAEHAFRQAIERLQALADEFPDAPEYRQHLAVTLSGFSVLLGNTGRLSDAEKAIRRALDLQESLVADFPTVPEHRRDLGRSYNIEGRGRAALRQRPEAERSFCAALAIQNRLVSEFPAVDEYRKDLADSYTALSSTLVYLGRPEEAQRAKNEGVGLLEKLVAEFPANPAYRAELAGAYYRLAESLPDQEAETVIQKALDLQEKLAADYPAVTDIRYDLFRSLERQAELMAGANRIEDAERTFRRAAAIGDKLAADAPAVAYYRSRLASVYRGLANVLSQMDRLPEAESQYEASIRLYEQQIVEFPDVHGPREQIVHSYMALAKLLASSGRQEEAEKVCRQAVALWEKLVAEHPNDRQARKQLAWALTEASKNSQVGSDLREQVLRRTLALHTELANEPPGDPDHIEQTGHVYRFLGWHQRSKGRLDEARQNFEKGVDVFAKLAANKDVPQRDGFYRDFEGDTHLQLARLLAAGGQPEAAEKAARQAIDIYKALATEFPTNGAYLRQFRESQTQFVVLLKNADRGQEAELFLNVAISGWQRAAADSHAHPREQLGFLHRDLASLLDDVLKKPAEAEQSHLRAVAVFKELANDFPATRDYQSHFAHSVRELALFLQRQGRPQEAIAGHRQEKMLFETLANDHPYHRWVLAHTNLELGELLFGSGQAKEEADQFCGQALELFTKLTAEFPANAEYRNGLVDCYQRTGAVLAANGRTSEAEQAYEHVLQIRKKQTVDFPDKPDYWIELADFYLTQGDRLVAGRQSQEAKQAYRQALAIKAKLAADFPDNREYRAGITRSYTHVTEALLAQAKHAEAEAMIREAIDEFEKLSAAHPTTPDYLRSRAAFQRQLAQRQAADQRAEEATRSYLEAINSYEQVIAQFPQYEDLWRVYDGLAQALSATNQFEEAEEARRKTVELAPSNAGTLNNLAWGFATAADLDARNASLALGLANKGIELEPSNVFLANTLGVAHYRAGNWREAITWLEKSMGSRNGGDAFDWFFLAMAHWQLGDFEQARKWCDQGVQWMEKNSPTNAELIRFRTEAEQLLGGQGATDAAPPQPPDVAAPSVQEETSRDR